MIRADEVSGKGPVAGYHIVVSAVVKVNTTLQKVAEQIKGIKVDGNTPVDYSLPLTVSKHHPNNLIKYDAPDPDADDASGSGDGEGPENAWG